MKIQEITKRAEALEKELISILLFSPNKIPTASKLIQSDELVSYQKEYSLLTESYKSGKNISTEFGLAGFKTSTFLEVTSFRDVILVCKEIKEIGNAYRIFGILEGAIKNIPTQDVSAFVAETQRDILKNLKHLDEDSGDIKSVISEFYERQKVYTEKFKNGGGLIGFPTGFGKLDNVIDGLRPEHLWVVGGYTSTGKTFASLNIVASLVKQGKRVVFYSFEMSKLDILSRLVGIMTEQSGISILKGFEHNSESVEEAFKQIEASGLTIHSFNSELSEVISSMYEESFKGVDLFVVDFLQLVTLKGSKSEYETMTNSILEFQQSAKRFKSPIIVLSQISNEGAKAGESQVMSFKGSGSIASASDLAIEIKSGEDNITDLKNKLQNGEPVKMKWDIKKNRHGRVGTIDMMFDGRTGVVKEAKEVLF